MFRAFPYPYSSKMYSYFMVYYHSLAYKLKMAPFLIDRIQQVHILAHTKDTPEAQTPSQLPRHNKTPIRGIQYELIHLNNYIYTQQNVSKCGGIGHKYVSEYVSKKALPDYHREGFFYPSINHPAGASGVTPQSTIPQNLRTGTPPRRRAPTPHGKEAAARRTVKALSASPPPAPLPA